MMRTKNTAGRVALFILFTCLGAISQQSGEPRNSITTKDLPATQPKIAFTFDDLPAHATLPPGETRIEVAKKIISALREFKVPSTYGFVNAQLLEKQPADINVIQAWIAAGNKVGNHTWSHMNLNQHSIKEFEEEIEKNEPVLKKAATNDDYRWLRFPYLARGETPEKRAEIRQYLHERGYKIAGVTMSFADYLYSDPYARCVAKGDTDAISLLEKTYLAAADEDITYRRDLSQKLFGRDIAYVLLMHLGAFEAKMMPQLLELYRSRGFQFVTLEEAEKDEFYKTEIDTSLPAAPDNLEGTMSQRGLTPPPHAIAQPNFDNLCR